MTRIVLLLAALFAVACKVEVGATQILVNVTSELGPDVASVDVQLFDEYEMKSAGPPTKITKPAPSWQPFSFTVVPPAKRGVRNNLIVLTALDAQNVPLGIVKTLVSFIENQTVQVELRFTQACRGRVCPTGMSCAISGAGVGECSSPTLSQGTIIDPSTVEGNVSGDGGAGSHEGGVAPATGGPGAAAGAGGTQAMGSPAGGTQSMGTTSGGSPSGPGGTASMGGGDGGSMLPPDDVSMPECDATRTCSAGYSCTAGKCLSKCEQTRCDPNATCALTNGAPVCTCSNGYISQAGTGGAVTCLRDVSCTELRCDLNASCDPGPNGQRVCTCKTGYTGTGMSCTPVSCGPLSVTNGSVQTNGATYGQTATYICDTGYKSTGGTARKCEVTGWSGTAPTCQPFDCGTLLAPTRGNVSVSGTKYPSGTATYSCNSGFSISTPSPTRTCTATGWSGTAPTCIGCGDGTVQSPRETCDPASFGQDPWRCDPTTCQTTTMYIGCKSESACSAGQNCLPFGCTFGCTSASQCPTPAGGSKRAVCAGGFGCAVGCTSTSQCPTGLVCDTAAGFCNPCTADGPACPLFTTCNVAVTVGGRCE